MSRNGDAVADRFESRHVFNCKLFTQSASAASILIGGLALLGWWLRVPALTSVVPGLATMKPLTAICFILSGISLWLVRLSVGAAYPDSQNLKFSFVTSIAVSAVGLFSFAEYAYDLAPAFDELIFHNAVTGTILQHPGRMSPATAFGFLLLGSSLFWIGRSNHSPRIPQVLGLIVFFNGFVSVVGYTYGPRALYLVPAYQSMAINTAFLFVLLGLGVVTARPQAGLMIPVTSEHSGGVLIRGVLPALIVLTVATGWIRLWGEKQGFYQTEFGTALRTVSEVATLIIVLWVAAYLLNHADVKRRFTEEAMRRSEESFRSLFEQAPDGIFTTDAAGQFLDANRAGIEMLGYSLDELRHLAVRDIVSSEDLDRLKLELDRLATGELVISEWRFQPKASPFRHGELVAKRLTDGRLHAILRDVTERKQAEEAIRAAENRFATIFQKAAYATMLIHLPDGVIADVNPSWTALFGHSKEEAVGRTGLDLKVFPDAETRMRLKADFDKHGFLRDREIQVQTKSGASRTLAGNWDYVQLEGEQFILASFQDITERKQAEEELRKSEANYRSVVESASDGIYIVDDLGRYVDGNELGCRMLGYTREELLSMTLSDIVVVEDQSRLAPELARLKAGELVRSEWLYCRKDGSLFPGEVSGTILPDGRNIGIMRDITERRRSEQALRESEEKFRSLADFVPQMVWMCTPDGLNIYFNQRWVEYTGMSLEESYGRGWNTPFHDEDKQRAWDAWNHAVSTGDTYQVESRLRAADGNYRWFLMQGTPLRDTTGEIIKWFGTCTDIEEMKQAEKALSESEASLKEAQSIAQLGSFDFDFKKGIWKSSAVMDTLLGIGPGYDRSLAGWLALVHPDDQASLADYSKIEVLSQLSTTNLEYRIIRRADQAERWLWSRATLERDAEGHPTRMYGTSMDITERKQAEMALRRSEQEFRTMANAMPQLSWMANPDGWIYWYNQRWYQYTGKTPRQMEGWGWQSVHDPAQLPMVMERWRDSISTGELFEMTFPLLGADGKFRAFLTRVSPLKDETGKVIRWFGTNTDIEEQKIIENRLRELSGELLHLQDEERRRIARELHDTTAQELAGLCINLSMLDKAADTMGLQERELLANCRSIANDSLSGLRTVSYLLHPPLLDEAGLESALQWFVEGFMKRSGITVKLDLDRSIGRLPQETELAIFRIVQESLGNIHRHSKSAVARVSLRRNGAVTLQIEDEGVGVGLSGDEPSLEAVARLGVGIAGMTERVRQLGGVLAITDRKPKGTIVRAVIPLEAKSSEAARSHS